MCVCVCEENLCGRREFGLQGWMSEEEESQEWNERGGAGEDGGDVFANRKRN